MVWSDLIKGSLQRYYIPNRNLDPNGRWWSSLSLSANTAIRSDGAIADRRRLVWLPRRWVKGLILLIRAERDGNVIMVNGE